MALIIGEPFGSFGTMMPQGHTSVYFDHLCVASPVQLRPCKPGEPGAVISRYHDLRHPDLDWLAFPLPVFLYGTADPANVVPFITAPLETNLRNRYWQEHLTAYIAARTTRHGEQRPPAYGDWEEGIGAAFDRRLFLYSFQSTPAQDQAALHWINDIPNRRRYALGRHNCADFVADLLRIALPSAVIRRNVLADFDMTTPKTLAREVDSYGHEHPEFDLRVYEIPQVPGSLRRSRPIRGAAESLISQKRYFVVVLALQPELMLADWIIYEKRGRWRPGADAVTTSPGAWFSEVAPAFPAQRAAATDETPDSPSPQRTDKREGMSEGEAGMPHSD